MLSRFIIFALAGISGYLLFPIVADYTGYGRALNASVLREFIETRAQSSSLGGSAVNLSDMSPPLRVLNYAFRPTLLEARSITYLISAIDNLIISWIFLYLVLSSIFSTQKRSQGINNTTFLYAYIAVMWMVLGMTTANLGIAQRQKWMFMPALIILYAEYQLRVTRNRKKQVIL